MRAVITAGSSPDGELNNQNAVYVWRLNVNPCPKDVSHTHKGRLPAIASEIANRKPQSLAVRQGLASGGHNRILRSYARQCNCTTTPAGPIRSSQTRAAQVSLYRDGELNRCLVFHPAELAPATEKTAQVALIRKWPLPPTTARGIARYPWIALERITVAESATAGEIAGRAATAVKPYAF
jgi:hypothetical protein